MIIIIIMIQILGERERERESAGTYVQKLTAPFAMHSTKRKQLCIVDTIQFAKEEVAHLVSFILVCITQLSPVVYKKPKVET